MYKYPIKIELLSETIWGNGESENGVVNTDILIDNDGFPYLLGKTFKGYLKKAVNDILKPLGIYNKHINKIFKDKVSKKNGNDTDYDASVIRFTNFYLDDAIKVIFDEEDKDRKNIILEALTDIRFANNIKEEKLRTSRVLKKGLIFNGYIETTDELDEEQLNFIKMAAKSLKHMGISKSRGKGLVKVEAAAFEKVKERKIYLESKNFEYILYEINLIEPVKIGNSQSQYDYEETKGYISGANVRGAIISKYLSKFKVEDKSFDELLKKVCFYDAYPIFKDNNEKHYSFPTPNIFRIAKDTDKDKKIETYETPKHYSTVFEKQKVEVDSGNGKKKIERRVIKLKKGEFSYVKDETLHQFNIRKDYRFHHTQEKDDENIFRYESIARGQKFYGVIDLTKVHSPLKNKIYEVIKKDPTLYLGGARTAGYGKTEISSVETIESFELLINKLTYLKAEDKETLDIYFLSDGVLRGENHQIISEFSDDYIKNMLSIDVNNKKMDISPTVVTGFNTKYGSPLPQVYGIEKGSVIRYEGIKKLDIKKVNEFIKLQHGDRKQDGLGRVIINPKFLYVKAIKTVKYEIEEVKNKEVVGSNAPIVKNIKNSIEDIKIEQAINKYTSGNISSFDGFKNLSVTKVNNIITMINKCLKEENYLGKFKDELKKLDTDTQNLDRNSANSDVLKLELFKDLTMRDIKNDSIDVIKAKIKKEVFNDLESINEEIILKAIRSMLYFALKNDKRGERQCVR